MQVQCHMNAGSFYQEIPSRNIFVLFCVSLLKQTQKSISVKERSLYAMCSRGEGEWGMDLDAYCDCRGK